jgi:hypothetical protein
MDFLAFWFIDILWTFFSFVFNVVNVCSIQHGGWACLCTMLPMGVDMYGGEELLASEMQKWCSKQMDVLLIEVPDSFDRLLPWLPGQLCLSNILYVIGGGCPGGTPLLCRYSYGLSNAAGSHCIRISVLCPGAKSSPWVTLSERKYGFACGWSAGCRTLWSVSIR